MSGFAVRYEMFCRALLLVVVVNVAMVAYTVRGLLVGGALPSIAAAYATYRTWLLDEDRGWSISRTWRTFAQAWHTDLAGANLLGWPMVALWALVALDHRVLQQVSADTLGLVASGALIAAAMFYLVFTILIWMVRAHYDEPLRWQLRTTFVMVIARPLCSLMLLAVAFVLLWVVLTWPALVLVFGGSAAICAASVVIYSFGRLPGLDARERAGLSPDHHEAPVRGARA